MARKRWSVVLACGHAFLMHTESGRPPAPRQFGCDCTLPMVEVVSVEEDKTFIPGSDD